MTTEEAPDFQALAAKAKEYTAGLTHVSRRVCSDILAAYARGSSTDSKERFDIATQEAIDKLTEPERARTIAVQIGVKRARQALARAREALGQE